jgi:hypothetical protein
MIPEELSDALRQSLQRLKDVTLREAGDQLYTDQGTNTFTSAQEIRGSTEIQLAKAKRDLHLAKREARVLRNIVQQDHPDELEVMRGLREWHQKNVRRRREVERERDDAKKRIAELERERDEARLFVCLHRLRCPQAAPFDQKRLEQRIATLKTNPDGV